MKTYDIVVCGGGFAGVSAAISAARKGANVILIDVNNCLGGAAGECLVNPFMPYYTQKDGELLLLSDGLFTEICENLKKLSSDFNGDNYVSDGKVSKTFNEE